MQAFAELSLTYFLLQNCRWRFGSGN